MTVPIQSGDIKLFASQVMDDVAEGGGRLVIDLRSGVSSVDGRASGSSSVTGSQSGSGGRVTGTFSVPDN